MLIETTVIEEIVRVPGQQRLLEGLLAYPSQEATCSVLIAGPHPFLGGDMGNNVVSAHSKALASHGAVVLTFNYSGVGRSEGGPIDWPAAMSAFWREGTIKEEGDWAYDAGSAIAALREWCDLPLVLIGYSFGCQVIADNLRGSRAVAVILISPNPRQHTFEQLDGCEMPLLVIHSDNDFTCGASEIIAWVKLVREPKTRIQLSAGEHFFRGHEEIVAGSVLEFLRPYGMLKAK